MQAIARHRWAAPFIVGPKRKANAEIIKHPSRLKNCLSWKICPQAHNLQTCSHGNCYAAGVGVLRGRNHVRGADLCVPGLHHTSKSPRNAHLVAGGSDRILHETLLPNISESTPVYCKTPYLNTL